MITIVVMATLCICLCIDTAPTSCGLVVMVTEEYELVSHVSL